MSNLTSEALSADFASEIDWWASYLAGRPQSLFDATNLRDAFPHFLLKHLNRVPSPAQKISALELGSGPLSLLAWGVSEQLLEVTAVDALADQYAGLLARFGISWPVIPIVGIGERLPDAVRASQYDLVYSSNALDHSQEPVRCVAELVSLAKPNGLVVFEGFCNEGTAAKWVGLHQHDLYSEGGHLMQSDRNRVVTRLTAGQPVHCLEALSTVPHLRGLRSSGYEYVRADGTFEPWYDRAWYSLVYRKLQA